MGKIILKRDRDKSVRRQHPWVFSGAIADVQGFPGTGDTVQVLDSKSNFLAHGAYSSESQIQVRIWSFDKDEKIDNDFFKRKIKAAALLRKTFVERPDLTAYRVIHSESDGLPGLTVDRYGDYLICQFGAAGVEKWKDVIVQVLAEEITCAGIYERSDLDIRKKEGLPESVGLLWGTEPPDRIVIQEGAVRFSVDIRIGHKTGYYLDQRASREKVLAYSRGKDVLNCFSYTGGFGLAALAGGANKVVNVDTSGPAIQVLEHNLNLNDFDKTRSEQVVADVFNLLRTYRDTGKRFDLIVLDPPKFIDSKANLERGARGYKDINMLAFKLLKPGGVLFTFSCSGLMEPQLFQKIVFDAAFDAQREGKILEHLEQAACHPIALNFPEGAYLKGMVVAVS